MSYSDSFYVLFEIFVNQIFISLALVISIVFLFWLKREKNLPPGPTGLPIVGYLPFLGKEAYKTLHSLTQKYGPIYSLYLGPKLVIVLGKFDVVKEALSNNYIMDRPKNPPNHLMPNSTNLSVSSGQIWKEQRRFSFQLLRQLGMAKQEMEEQILSEIQKLILEIDKAQGKALNLDALLYSSVSNNILNLLIGQPLNYEDENRIFLNKMLKTMTIFFRPTRIHAYFPWSKRWMAKLKIWGYDNAEQFMKKLSNYIESQIEEHKKNFDEHVIRDYIDGYLKAMKNTKEANSYFSEKMLKGNFQSLFSAGSTPSRAALEWSILSVAQYPELQEKIHQELDSVIDREKCIKWSDYTKLPYTLATIYEAMRQNTAVPISMLRCTSARTQIAGYDIPKGAIIMTNIWGVHHDHESWDDPFAFKPERFIQDGKTIKPEEFIPFSYGKRNCPGEDMAIITVFLYFANLLLRYNVSLPNNNYDVKEISGVARLIVLDNIHLSLRN